MLRCAVLCCGAFAGILSSCPVCHREQEAVNLSEIKNRRAVMASESLARELPPLMADALFEKK